MKVLQINAVYKQGSTGKIVYDIHRELIKHGTISTICYGQGEKSKEPGIYRLIGTPYAKLQALESRITGLMYGGCRLSTQRLIRIIQSEKPDIVHLHCINGHFVNIYRIIKWLKDNKMKTVLTLHAEFMYTANCGYSLECEKWKTGCGKCPRLKKETKSWLFDRTHDSWLKMKEAFEGFSQDLVVVSVSPWLMERAIQSPVLRKMKHVTILNGIDTDVFKPYKTDDLKASLGLSVTAKTILHVTADFSLNTDHIKGGYYVSDIANRMKNDNVQFIIAGPYDQTKKYPSNMLMLGRITNQVELAKLYSMADITLLTSKKETFSMIVAESLCCGTPIVGFEAGAPEQIAINEHCDFVTFGDVEALEKTLREKIACLKDSDKISRSASEKYAKNIMSKKYYDLYEDVLLP